MSKRPDEPITCEHCGEIYFADERVCPSCGGVAQPPAPTHAEPGEWERERRRLRNLWVIAVVFFWFSFFFQGALYFMEGTFNLVLLSVIFGMMILGVVLKSRLQLHERRKP